MKSFQVDASGFYGRFGGAYVPEILYKTVEDLKNAYLPIIESKEFQDEYRQLLRDYVGRPSPLYFAKRMSERYGCQLYLKREDLNHTGAHKINNAIGQILIAKRMGKTRIVAETGAGQHGVATATVCALMNMPCRVYMGALDVQRQHVNVERMKMLGAEVYPVESGNRTLKDATNEAIRDWCCHPSDTFYIIGSTVGPHPYPDMVARLQSIISEELKWQLREKVGRDYPDYLMACVGGGSNAAGTIYHYIDDERVRLVLAEAGGHGIDSGETAASMQIGTLGILHGSRIKLMQTDDGHLTILAPAPSIAISMNRSAPPYFPPMMTRLFVQPSNLHASKASYLLSRVHMPWPCFPNSSICSIPKMSSFLQSQAVVTRISTLISNTRMIQICRLSESSYKSEKQSLRILCIPTRLAARPCWAIC